MLTTSAAPLQAFERSAALYDAIYSDGRRYERDVDRIINLVAGPAIAIDWGCGTGELAWRLESLGWSAIGFDRSPEMVQQARLKLGGRAMAGDICKTRSSDVPEQFRCGPDVQTCLFATFSYATITDGQLTEALQNVRRWAEPGGLFMFDVVNYSAAAAFLEGKRNIAYQNMQRWIRKQFNLHDSILTCELTYQPRTGPNFAEHHTLRAYTPREISAALKRHGFDVLEMFDPESPGPKGGPIRPDSYYFMTVARVR